MQSPLGFDNASADRANDDLDRWRFALDIADVILETPLDWSARIGVFGRWGTGKSTVLRYLRDALESKGSIVFDFNPSFDSNFNEVLSSFGVKLIEELDKQGIFIEPKVKRFVRKSRWLRSDILTTAVGATSEWFKGAKLAGTGLSAVSLWLSPSGDQIRKICEKLPEQRLVVLIDDLDRSSAELLPKFLLSLRELLDLPRFTFVLAFDEALVGKALSQVNPAWEEGSDFLEKILDFRFTLPMVDTTAKRKLLCRALQENADFVPLSSIDEVEELISENPRKLKALVRGLRSLKPVIERHKPSEFEWTDVWLVQLLRQEAHDLVNDLNDKDIFDGVLGFRYKFLIAENNRRTNGSSSKDDQAEALFNKAALSESTQQRVRAILEAMRARGSIRLQYVLGWPVAPPAVTWKEFGEIVAKWSAAPSPSAMESAMRIHAQSRSDSDNRVQQEVINALSMRLDELLDQASRFHLADDLDLAYSDIAFIRGAVRDFFAIPKMLNADRFLGFYQKAQHWIAVRRSAIEEEARNAERKDLIALTKDLSDGDVTAIYEKLQPWSSRAPAFPGDDNEFRSSLRDEIAGLLRPRIQEQLAAFLTGPECMKKLSEPSRYLAFKGVLFGDVENFDSGAWAGIRTFIAKAANDDASYRNVEFLVKIWLSALNCQHRDIDADSVKALIARTDLLKDIWNALLSKDLLPRGCVRLLGLREKLIEAGAPGESLFLDQQLEKHLRYFEDNKDAVMRSL